MASVKRDYTIVDGHLHVFDLDIKNKFPNQNMSHGFPEDKNVEAINRTVPLEEARGFTRYCGVDKLFSCNAIMIAQKKRNGYTILLQGNTHSSKVLLLGLILQSTTSSSNTSSNFKRSSKFQNLLVLEI